MIIKHSGNSDTCIIYAHGLGSNKMESLSLVQCLQKLNYHICAFDFSGSGKSDGDFTTYGLREQDDINAILTWLDASRLYMRYVLWGRSMGGASIILSQSRNLNKKVQCMVLDSPFSSFERAAVEVASKFSLVPEGVLNFLIEPIK
jgi:alpha/beta superfamily hydrolase